MMKIEYGITSEELLLRKSWREALQKFNPAVASASAIVRLRADRGWSQMMLARKMGTTQSAVARAENGVHMPSVRFLSRVARATGTVLKMKFEEIN